MIRSSLIVLTSREAYRVVALRFLQSASDWLHPLSSLRWKHARSPPWWNVDSRIASQTEPIDKPSLLHLHRYRASFRVRLSWLQFARNFNSGCIQLFRHSQQPHFCYHDSFVTLESQQDHRDRWIDFDLHPNGERGRFRSAERLKP